MKLTYEKNKAVCKAFMDDVRCTIEGREHTNSEAAELKNPNHDGFHSGLNLRAVRNAMKEVFCDKKKGNQAILFLVNNQNNPGKINAAVAATAELFLNGPTREEKFLDKFSVHKRTKTSAAWNSSVLFMGTACLMLPVLSAIDDLEEDTFITRNMVSKIRPGKTDPQTGQDYKDGLFAAMTTGNARNWQQILQNDVVQAR